MKRIFLLAAIIFLFTSPISAFAADNFLTDYSVFYNVLGNGFTHVNFKVTLTNKTENYYASYYKIDLGLSDVTSIKASDGNGAVSPDVTKESSGTIIGVPFNQRIVGLGKKLSFNLDFNTTEIAQNLGRILEVNVPGLSNQNDFSSFSVNVSVPSAAGSPVYIKPAVASVTSNGLTFNKDTLGKSGVYIAYGDYQVYSFDLTYHLYNNNLFPVKTELALPPKTNYQDIQIDRISPAPKDVTVDKDGNWLAQYNLSSSQKLDIRVTGKAKIFLTPAEEQLSQSLRAQYLKPQPFWQSDSSDIKQLAQNLKTPEEIYDYVRKTLNYDFSRVTNGKSRIGAQKVLQNPKSAVCLEFTDLFIALARAAGIPAREVDGYAYTKNTRERPLSLVEDILHAWPQYYDDDSKTWVMVDPTWGNTTGGTDYFHTLDFDHFAFVIKGSDSSYPIPAGGYKLVGQENKKDVSVTVDSNFEENPAIFKTDLEISKSALPWTPISGKITIRNEGGQMSPFQVIQVDTKILNPKHQTIDVPAIPPYGQIIIPLNFTTSSILTNKEDQVTITLGQKSTTANVHISPFNLPRNQLLVIGGVLIVLFTLIILIITTKLWNLHLFRRKE